MRIGKPLRKSRAWKKVEASLFNNDDDQPQNISSETVIGRLNPDIIASVYAPYITRVAEKQLEQYATDLLTYQELMKDLKDGKQDSADIDADGNIRFENGQPIEPSKPLFSTRFNVDEAKTVLKETSDHFFQGGYRAHLNANKFERRLNEKYGRFRPFMEAHPEVEQFLRSSHRKYLAGHFSPFRQTSPPIPRSTAVVILFMMQRGKVRWEIMVLATLFFLVGLQPWALVAIVALVQALVARRRRKPLRGMKTEIEAVDPFYQNERDKQLKLKEPVGKPLNGNEQIDSDQYDVMILGTGPSSLYAAALLSRAGRRVLVLSSRNDASGCITFGNNYKAIPFDIEASNVSKVSNIQKLLAPALATTTDTQGGVRFCQIGSAWDGHAFEILSIFGVGTEGHDQECPFVLRGDGGLDTLMDDAAILLGDGWPDSDGSPGNSATGMFVKACEAMNSTAFQYYLSKILPESWHSVKGSGSQYQECSVRYAQSLLDQAFPLNAHLRSLLAGIGMKGENIRPKDASMAPYVTNISAATSGEGMHYPVGGPRALGHAFANIIERNGGRVVTNVELAELVFGEAPDPPKTRSTKPEEGENRLPCPKCLGVKMSNGQVVSFDESRYENRGVSPAVVSMEGFLTTFIGLLPSEIRTKYKVPRGLPALASRRPVFKVLFLLQGRADDLDVTGADYYRLPNAAIAQDEVDPSTNQINCGDIGWASLTTVGAGASVESESDQSPVETAEVQQEVDTNRRGKRSAARRLQYTPESSWLQISFPSAKDPSFEDRHGDFTTCVVTIEADDDFVTFYDAQPKLYALKESDSSDASRLLVRVKKDLFTIYPQLKDKVAQEEIAGPFRRGLSHNPERYAAKGIRADTPYPGLYMGGNDLTIGESFGGGIVGAWLAANAVAEYSPVDHLFLQKNLTSDIQRFLDPPLLDEEDDEHEDDVKDKDI